MYGIHGLRVVLRSSVLSHIKRSLDRVSKIIGGPIPVDIMSKITQAVCILLMLVG